MLYADFMKYKYYRYQGGLAQIPDVKHSLSLRFILGGALEISWADYLWFAKLKTMKLKSKNYERDAYYKRTKEEIERKSNIERSVEQITASMIKKRNSNRRRYQLHPEIQRNYRMQRKQQLVDNFVGK